MFFCTILIPLILLAIAAYESSSFFCNLYSITCIGGENRTGAGLALASKSDSRYVCRPADLLVEQTAKPASVRFPCSNVYWIDQAGLLAGRTRGSAGEQIVQNIYNEPESPQLFQNWYTFTLCTNRLWPRWATKHPDTHFKHLLHSPFVYLRCKLQLCDPVSATITPCSVNMDATTTKVNSLIPRLTETITRCGIETFAHYFASINYGSIHSRNGVQTREC